MLVFKENCREITFYLGFFLVSIKMADVLMVCAMRDTLVECRLGVPMRPTPRGVCENGSSSPTSAPTVGRWTTPRDLGHSRPSAH